MKKSIKYFIAIIAVLVLAFAFAACNKTENSEEQAVVYGENLLKNGDFESNLSNWTYDKGDSGYVYYNTVNTNKESDTYNSKYGEYQLELKNLMTASYVVMTQNVYLKEGVTYLFSADINVTEDITKEGDAGAYVAFSKDSTSYRINIVAATNGYTSRSFYFTPNKTDTYAVNIGLGTKTAAAKGSVYFDNISIIAKTDAEIAEGTVITNIGVKSGTDFNNTSGILFVTLLTVLGAAICVGGYFALSYVIGTSDEEFKEKLFGTSKAGKFFTSTYFYIVCSLLCGFIVRFILALTVNGMTYEINTLSNYASALVNKGLPSFFVTYPSAGLTTGSLYLLSIIGGFAKLTGVSFASQGFYILLKIPAIICDLVIIYLIFSCATKYLSKIASFALALTYALLPAVFTVSSAWGQLTSVGALFMLLSVIALVNKKSWLSVVFYYLAIIFEPIVLAFVVFYVGVLVIRAIKYSDERLPIIISTVCGFIVLFLIAIPFDINFIKQGKVFRFITDIALAVKGKGVYTANTFNLFGLVGNNLISVSGASVAFNILLIVVCSAWLIYMYLTRNNRLYVLLSASAIMVVNYVFCLYQNVYFVVFPVTLMVAYFAFSKDKRVLWATGGLAVVATINLTQLMSQSGYIGSGANASYLPFEKGNALMIIMSIVNVLIALYYIYVVYSIVVNKSNKELEQITSYKVNKE